MIHRGDLFNVLPTLDAESVDACVTDPPYDLTANKRGGTGEASLNLASPAGRSRITTGGGFMGKKWDGTGVAFKPETWREVFRVLKPGAHLVAFGGTRTFHRLTCAIDDAGFEIRDCLSWLYATGFPKSLNIGDGRGTALKPGWEPIVLARKPFRDTVAVNVLKHGTGALNIDACRIEGSTNPAKWGGWQLSDIGYRGNGRPGYQTQKHDLGRWPANVVLDEEAAAMLDEQSGELTSGATLAGRPAGTNFSQLRARVHQYDMPASSGGASRFYYVAKPSREERDYGCDSLPLRRTGTMQDDAYDWSREAERGRQPRETRGRNIHPTVKPVELMRWLVRLVTPINGTVLDPFCGSGTTGMACRYELQRFIGIEREPEYADIAERRIAAVAPLFAGEDGT